MDKNIESEISKFQTAHGINLLDLTKAAENRQGCVVESALYGLPEQTRDEAFHLIGATNADRRKTDPTLAEVQPFDERQEPVSNANVIARGYNLAWNSINPLLFGKKMSSQYHDLKWQGYHAMGLRVVPSPIDMLGGVSQSPATFESWNASTHFPIEHSCNNYVAEADYAKRMLKKSAHHIEEK